ncbi:unnamed protein product [Gadus morhua 'NCC']
MKEKREGHPPGFLCWHIGASWGSRSLRSGLIPPGLGGTRSLSNDLQTPGAQGRVSGRLIGDKQPELAAQNDGAGQQPHTGLQCCVTPVVTAVHCVNPPAPLDRGCPPSAGAVTAPCHGAGGGGPGPWCLRTSSTTRHQCWPDLSVFN